MFLVFLAAAAAAAPNRLPEELNASLIFDVAYHADTLARFRASVDGLDELGKIQSTARVVSGESEEFDDEALPSLLAFRPNPSLTEINAPFAANLLDGDIMVHPSSILNETSRNKRGAPYLPAMKWNKEQPIAFKLDNGLDEQAKFSIRIAARKFGENTCLSFRENGSGPSLWFFKGDGCYSYVGWNGDTVQTLSIGSGCSMLSIVMHEMAHALGIKHTQTRKDRDAYVTVNFANIRPGREGQYYKLSDSENDNLGVPYEYGSAMHYTSRTLSNGGQITMVPKDIGYKNTMGQKMFMTFNDYKMINLFYNCSASCSNKITCQNGGYQSYKNCNACICPEYFTGTNCQTATNRITISSSTPFKTNFKQKYDRTAYRSNNTFNWDMFTKDAAKVITAPAERKIRVTINRLYGAEGKLNCYDECPLFGVEFADTAGDDLTSVGKHFCCTKDEGLSFVSKSNVIGYKAFVSPGWPFESQVTFTVV